MRNKSGDKGRSFGKRNDSGDKKSFGKGKPSFSGKAGSGKSYSDKGKPFFKKKDDAGTDKPKRKSFTSEDFGGEKKSRSNSYASNFDDGSGKPAYKKKSDYSDKDSSSDKKPKRDFGSKYGNKSESKPYSKRNSDDVSNEKPKRDFGSKYGDKKEGKSYVKRDSDSSFDGKPYSDRKPKKEFGDKPFGEKRPYKKRDDDSSFAGKPKKEFGDKSYGDKKPFKKRDDAGYERKPKSFGDGEKKSYGDKPYGEKKPFKNDDERKPKTFGDGTKKSYGDKPYGDKRSFKKKDDDSSIERKPKRNSGSFGDGEKRSYDKKDKDRLEGKRPRIERKSFSKSNPDDVGKIRLNKYISNSGICSRREADKLIESGAVTVNGKIVAELGYKVSPDDVVGYGGQSIRREKKVYVLLNKPKDYITTTDDPEGRKTVMELIKGAGKERIYPVGRLDRNTTGLLMLTNDGEMAMKLTHPKNNIQKMYSVEIDKGIRPEDLKALHEGIELEDGFIKADHVELVGEGSNRKEIGIELHSGKNRIVRRMFEQLGYNVVRLDRVMFAGLTKKDLPRGKWRFITEKELSFLKMLK